MKLEAELARVEAMVLKLTRESREAVRRLDHLEQAVLELASAQYVARPGGVDPSPPPGRPPRPRMKGKVSSAE